MKHLLPIVLEFEETKIVVPANPMSSGVSLAGLQMAILLYLQVAENSDRESKHSYFFPYKGTNLIHEISILMT